MDYKHMASQLIANMREIAWGDQKPMELADDILNQWAYHHPELMKDEMFQELAEYIEAKVEDKKAD